MEEQRLYKIPYLISWYPPKRKAPKAKQAHVVKKHSFPPRFKNYTFPRLKNQINNKTQYLNDVLQTAQ